MKIKKVHLFLFFLLLIYSTFLSLKHNFGELTPDEKFYTLGEDLSNTDISFKFLLTQKIISELYTIHRFLFPLLNIIIALFLFKHLYEKEYLKQRNLSKKTLLLIFLLPSTIFFTTAYLRDIYIFFLGLSLIFSSTNDVSRMRIILLFLLFAVLRYEAGLIIFLAYVFNSLLTYKNKILFRVRKVFIPLIFLFSWIILMFFLQNDVVWKELSTFLAEYEESTSGYGILQLDIKKENVILGSVVNWIAFYAPFFFKDITSLFDHFLLVESLVVFYLLLRFLWKFDFVRYRNDHRYRISFFVIIATFFIAIPESIPETIFRHRMAYLPFLIYLNFPLISLSSFRENNFVLQKINTSI